MKSTKKVIRSTPGKVEFREAIGPDHIGILSGYTARFGVESCVLWDADVIVDEEGQPLPFVEVLDPHCFYRTLRESPDVVALYNHDSSAPLGRTTAGTLDLNVDSAGLAFVDRLPDTTHGNNAKVSVRRNDIKGCSFGFVVLEDRVDERPGLPALRTVLDMILFEVTIACTFPAYTATETQLRSLERAKLRGISTPKPDPRALLDHLRKRLRLRCLG
jgi:HK97 family phage prohead protease